MSKLRISRPKKIRNDDTRPLWRLHSEIAIQGYAEDTIALLSLVLNYMQ